MEPLAHSPTTRGRVLMVAPQPFFRVTGTPINVLMMCRALGEGGYEVDLLALPGGEDLEVPSLTLHRTPRLPFAGAVPVGFSPQKLVYNLLVLGRLVGLLARRRYVAVHAIEEAAFYAVPLARLAGVPAFTDLDSDLARQLRDHGSVVSRLLAGPAGTLRRLTLRRSSCVISVARRLTLLARTEAPEVPVVEINDIPVDSATRAPDPARVAALRRDLDLEDRRVVVYTGNLDRRQGVEDLIAAVATVRARHPDVVLLVVGGTPERVAALHGLASRSGMAEAVRLIGVRPPEDMADYMALADVLASPRLEPYATPLKIFSYMASGRPIVATDLPTHTDVLDASVARLVPPRPDGLARGIEDVLSDARTAWTMAARARALVEERYTYALFKERLLAAYQDNADPAHGAGRTAIQETPAHG